MFRAKKLSVVMGLSFLLSACSHGKDPALYWAHHPEQLKNAVMLCNDQTNPGEHCQQIMAVYSQLSTLAESLAQNPELYGQRIMQAQQQIALLKNKLSQMHGQSADDLRNQLLRREKAVALMLAIAGDAGE